MLRGQSERFCRSTLKRGGGSPSTFYETVFFEIAVDRHTRIRDQTFEGVPELHIHIQVPETTSYKKSTHDISFGMSG